MERRCGHLIDIGDRCFLAASEEAAFARVDLLPLGPANLLNALFGSVPACGGGPFSQFFYAELDGEMDQSAGTFIVHHLRAVFPEESPIEIRISDH